MTVSERILTYLKYRDITPRKFSLSVGKVGPYFSNNLKSGSSPSADILSHIIETYPELNIKWVLTGDGEMLVANMSVSEPSASYTKRTTLDELLIQKIDDRIEEYLKENDK